MGLTNFLKGRWLRRSLGAFAAVLTALVLLPVPVLASVTFSGSWTPTYIITGTPTPPTPTFGDSLTSNGSHGQEDVLTVGMGTYNQGSPNSNPNQQPVEEIILKRTITWSPSGAEKLFSNWTLLDFLNQEAKGSDQVDVLNTNGTLVTPFMGQRLYTGSGTSPSQVSGSALEHLTSSQLPAGTYQLQVTVKFQTLANNQLGGQWNSRKSAHKFDFYAQ
jgi:hypothetical protein